MKYLCFVFDDYAFFTCVEDKVRFHVLLVIKQEIFTLGKRKMYL